MIEAVLARLDGVQKKSGYYLAKCPHHNDKVRSLSVSEGDKGVLFRCHAGCSFEEITTTLGFRPSELFYEKNTTDTAPNAQKICATYNYTDEGGELIYQVVRLEPKSFRQRRQGDDGRWVWSLGDTPRVLYNLPKVKEQIEKGGWVFVVEGEKDVERLSQEGFTATTNAGGATAWRDEYTTTLAGAKGVVILPDNDAPGKKHAYTVQAALKTVGTDARIIELPGLPEKGDISTWFDTGGTRESLMKLVKSDFVRPADMVNLTDALTFVAKYTAEPLPKGLSFPWPRINKLSRGLRPGWLCYIAGRPGHGKTAAGIELAIHNAQQGHRVLMISMEMGGEELGVRVAQRCGLDTWRFYSGNPSKADQEAVEVAMNLPYHSNIEIAYTNKLQRIEELICACEPKLLIVDYLGLVDIGSRSRYDGTTRVSHAAKDLARRYGLPSVWLVQMNRAVKGEKIRRPVSADLRDSGDLEQDADQIIFVHRMNDGEDETLSPDGEFVLTKARMGIPGIERHHFDGATQTFICKGE